jgi:hypothetical protein
MTPAVVALGGGAIGTDQIRSALRDRAVTVLVEIDPEEAWRRVGWERATAGPGRGRLPDAVRGAATPLRRRRGCARPRRRRSGARAGGIPRRARCAGAARRARSRRGAGRDRQRCALVAGIYGMDVQLALGARAQASHELAPGEQAKNVESLEALWHALRLRNVAARSSPSVVAARPTSQASPPPTYLPRASTGSPCDDPRRPGRRCDRRQDRDRPPRTPKNLVGSFHWPVRTVIDPATLETLPEESRNGRAEWSKTGLPGGEPFWELPLGEQVPAAPPAFKTGALPARPATTEASARSSTSGPHVRARPRGGLRTTPARTAAAVALGLLAALRLLASIRPSWSRSCSPKPVQVDRDEAWAALSRDKKVVDGVPRHRAAGAPRAGRGSVSSCPLQTFERRSTR